MIDEQTTFRGLTTHESETLRLALTALVNNPYEQTQYRRSARLMLDQEMHENFLWCPNGQQKSHEIRRLKDELARQSRLVPPTSVDLGNGTSELGPKQRQCLRGDENRVSEKFCTDMIESLRRLFPKT